jgi:ABC-type transport system involved in cytochrome bd biosynthesis fused ATPase/permease subunit
MLSITYPQKPRTQPSLNKTQSKIKKSAVSQICKRVQYVLQKTVLIVGTIKDEICNHHVAKNKIEVFIDKKRGDELVYTKLFN